MKDTKQQRFIRTAAFLAALMLVLSVFSPIGMVAAVDGITVSQQADSTTVNPGDTITFTTDVSVDEAQIDANSIGLQTDRPDGWEITRQDGDFLGAGPDGWLWFSATGVSGSDTVQYTVEVPDDAASEDYDISVTASTEGDESTTDTTTITVESQETNSAPNADAGSDQTVDEGQQVTLDATGSSDPDGDSLSYSWTVTDAAGTSVSLSDATSATPTFTAPGVDSETTLTFQVQVADGNGDTDTDSVNVTVQPTEPVNQAPTIDAIADQTVTEGDSETVSVSADDPDGDSVSLSLTQSPDFVSLSNGEITVAPEDGDAANSPYTVTVEADDGTATTTESFQVTVEEPAGSAVSVSQSADQTTVQPGDAITFTTDVSVDGSQIDANSVALQTDRPVGWEITRQDGDFLGAGPDGWLWFSATGVSGSDTVQYTVEVPDDAASGDYAVSVTASTEGEGGVSATDETTITVEEPTPDVTSAEVDITPDSGVDASTYNSGSFEVTNTGETSIQTVTLDTSETMLPDMVFDPYNTAGDDVGKEFTLDGGDVTVQNVEYTNFHNGENNEAGYDTLVVTLSGFEPGETMAFSVDMDPTSIDTTDLGSQHAGPVSGLETTGMTVSVDSGSGPVESVVVGDGSAGGATATVTEDTDESEPSIDAQGVTLSDVGLSDRHSAATVANAEQTIEISGAPANAEVTLLRVEGELNLNNVPEVYDEEDYEANDANQVEYYTVTTDSNGEATVDVTLTDNPDTGAEESGLNYFTAWVNEPDGDTGPVSDYAVLKLDPSADTGPGPVGDFTDPPTDPDGDGVYEDVNGDGTVNVGDAQALFAFLTDPVVQNNTSAFDVNDDGVVNVGDAQALFAEVSGGA